MSILYVLEWVFTYELDAYFVRLIIADEGNIFTKALVKSA